MDGGNIPPPVPVKLVRLGDDVWISEKDGSASDTSGPEVILLFSWMNAKIGHVIKYASYHRKLYPGSTIVVIQTNSSFFWSSEDHHRSILNPVMDLLKRKGIVGSGTAPSASLLVHAFSNGGVAQLTKLANILSSENQSIQAGPALPASAIIFDSCPGNTDLLPLLRAFTIGMPVYMKLPTYLMLTLGWSMLFCYEKLIASETGHILKARRDLNDATQLPHDAQRLYIYSKTDDLVPYTSVEEHMAEAKKLGIQADATVYEESPHCGHARTDEQKYWSAVAEFVKRSMP